MFQNHTWESAQWRALCTKISEVNLSAFIYRLFHEDIQNKYSSTELLEIYCSCSLGDIITILAVIYYKLEL